MNTDQIELSCGTRRARFRRDAAGWRPVGFFLGDGLRLRFKDDAFLSLNTLRPVAQTLERVGTGVRFGARTDYFGLPVDWSVLVTPEPGFNGFTIETAVTPTATLEVMEGLSFFETPAVYDDTEEALHVIGMNPVMKWRGTECVTPALPWNPIKAWSHKRAHRNLIATQTPLLATRLSQGGAIRGYAFLGHWDVCAARGLAVTPVQGAEPHGYLFDIGAMTWRTSSLKDPNYIFEAGQTQRQKVSLTYDDAPGGTIDEWLFAPFEFALRHYLPADGRRAPARVTLAEANRWWLELVTSDQEVPGLYHPERGMTAYCPGTDPMPAHVYSQELAILWLAGHLAYQSHITREPRWLDHYRRHLPALRQTTAGMAQRIGQTDFTMNLAQAMGVTSILQFLRQSPDAAMAAATRQLVDGIAGLAELGDHGSRAEVGLALAQAYEFFREPAFAQRALARLAEIEPSLAADFWNYGCEGAAGGPAAGGQVHTQGPVCAIHLALWAYRHTGDARHRVTAERFARLLAVLCYAVFNDSDDPDFDPRGWANGGTGGRDLFALFPPWESSEGIRAFVALLEVSTVPALYDLVWYFARNYLAAFPVARRNKRGFTPDGRQRLWRDDVVKSDAVIYRERYPFVAYEDPWNQTMLASYQTVDVFPNYLAFGGALAALSDDRLLALCPRTVRFAPEEATSRRVHVWNPGDHAIDTQLALYHLPPGRYRVTLAGQERALALPATIPLSVPGRTALIVEVTPFAAELRSRE